ncbi:MAG: hypothetical protein FRX48_06887 [Lasallia pustulata]|uniref:Uncharacterized protein n=1 Tax=Lasallia pustulata TaxID=136370 RepID=A0A5M8PL84_9LECA|nr:MAG: hypothetical protein FRX48_06887 [Lasallia pustulata]
MASLPRVVAAWRTNLGPYHRAGSDNTTRKTPTNSSSTQTSTPPDPSGTTRTTTKTTSAASPPPKEPESKASSKSPATRTSKPKAATTTPHGPHAHARPASAAAATPSPSQPSGGMSRFGRKMKDRITGTTHEQREKLRVERAEEERRIYARHQAIRQAMSRAMETGQPQLIGRDRDGKELYIEPPGQVAMPPGGYGYNPYTQGPYANPNATFVRPSYPYARPYGGGYGGGLGMPLMGG